MNTRFVQIALFFMGFSLNVLNAAPHDSPLWIINKTQMNLHLHYQLCQESSCDAIRVLPLINTEKDQIQLTDKKVMKVKFIEEVDETGNKKQGGAIGSCSKTFETNQTLYLIPNRNGRIILCYGF